MSLISYIIITFLSFIFQAWSSEFFTLGTIDPDFCVIILLYISIKDGGLVGTLFGFFVGLMIDFSAGTDQFLGLTPLIYSTTGYFSSFLKGENLRLNKIYFTSIWVVILLVQFFIFTLIVYQQLLIQDPFLFFIKWLATSLYTLVFVGILQVIFPLYKI